MFSCYTITDEDSTVIMLNGVPTISSLLLATMFNKAHSNVLRDIYKIINILPDEFVRKHFFKAQYKDQKEEMRTAYLMDFGGFACVAFSYSGKKATLQKALMIEKFEGHRPQLSAIYQAGNQNLEVMDKSVEQEIHDAILVINMKHPGDYKVKADVADKIFSKAYGYSALDLATKAIQERPIDYEYREAREFYRAPKEIA